MKKFCIFLCILALLALPVLGAENDRGPRLVDDADLLTQRQEAALLTQLDQISEQLSFDVIIVTVDSTGSKSARAYADDYFDYNGYGFGTDRSGVLLLVNMAQREWWISTSGYGLHAFTDAGIDHISEAFLPDLSDGNYADAFRIFAQKCEDFVLAARAGERYDSDNLPKAPFDIGKTLLISAVIGLIVSLLVTAIMAGQLKSVRKSNGAVNYIRPNSMRVTQRVDLYLYKNVTRTAKPKNSSSHTSSSGRSHGGGGGRF